MEKEVEDVALIKDVYTYLASKVYPDDCPGNRKMHGLVITVSSCIIL